MKLIVYCLLILVISCLIGPSSGLFASILSLVNQYNPIRLGAGLLGYDVMNDEVVHPTSSNLITPTPDQARYYMYFSAAIYCNDPRLSSWTCDQCKLTGPDVFLVAELNTNAQDRALVNINHSKKEIILTYRGTINFSNIFQDLTMEMISVPGGNGKVEVHKGAWDGMMALYDQVTGTIRSLLAQYGNYHVTITGHSLGAMFAVLSYYKLRNTPEFEKLDYFVITYGEPRTGNLEFALWFNSQRIPALRVVNNGDIVPHAIFSNAGFVHRLRELWIHDGKLILCSENMLEDPKCSNSLHLTSLSVADHVYYWDSGAPPMDCLSGHLLDYLQRYIAK